METIQTLTLGQCSIELICRGEDFAGLGKIYIGETQVRSGRLPLRPYTETFSGRHLGRLTLRDMQVTADEIRIRLCAAFLPMEVKLMRDHSFDPIHETGDWDAVPPAETGDITIVLTPSTYTLHGHVFEGFAYHYEYSSPGLPIFYLLDKASWELDGDIEGSTVYNQSSCSDPVVTFARDTFWSTEGELFFLDPAAHFNRVMTHNLPRWASHQAFDYQFRGNNTLIGMFDHVDLIRSLLRRDPSKPELKCFDKHIFDEAAVYSTSPKAILLHSGEKSDVDQQNLWTWLFDDVHGRARAQFGLREQPPVPLFAHHYWVNRTIDTYYQDIVPATSAIGIRAIFTENFKKSDATGPTGAEDMRLPNGNMCGSQDYEIADKAGGMAKFKEYIGRCHKAGVANYMWTNTFLSYAAPLSAKAPSAAGSWFLAMEDTRLRYAGAYTSGASTLSFKNPDTLRYWIDAHKAIAEESGLDGYYIDSYYNLFFMPLDYGSGHPRTVWREGLTAMRELQEAGVGFYIESFGPFGQPGHGHPSSYGPATAFICYYVGMGNDYTTVPVPGVMTDRNISHDPAFLFFQLAHKVPYAPPLFIDGKRVDEVYGREHRRIYDLYHEHLPQMRTRYLQEDGLGVLWHNDDKSEALLWNFTARTVDLPGRVSDAGSGQELPAGTGYALEAGHVYRVRHSNLPTCVGIV